jgi:iron complex transport system substrate-binding protein
MSSRPFTRGAALVAAAVVLDDDTLANAFSSGSALGIQYALENAVPLFADAL